MIFEGVDSVNGPWVRVQVCSPTRCYVCGLWFDVGCVYTLCLLYTKIVKSNQNILNNALFTLLDYANRYLSLAWFSCDTS